MGSNKYYGRRSMRLRLKVTVVGLSFNRCFFSRVVLMSHSPRSIRTITYSNNNISLGPNITRRKYRLLLVSLPGVDDEYRTIQPPEMCARESTGTALGWNTRTDG